MKMTVSKQHEKLALRGYISPLKGTNSVLTTSQDIFGMEKKSKAYPCLPVAKSPTGRPAVKPQKT
jgi:hypothetical protein